MLGKGPGVRLQFFQQKSLAFSFICAMVMVAFEVTPWIAFFSLGLLIWKWGVENLGWRSLPRRWTGALSVLLLAQTLIQYRTLIGQEPAYTFLLGLSALRVMDYQNDRDHKFIVMLGFVLISIKALFSLDIYWILPSGVAFAGFWFSLLPRNLSGRSKMIVKIFAYSIPSAVVLFFAFPRFVLPWAMSRGTSYGAVGFSDELNPGRVAELANIDRMVFRAKISGLPILSDSRELYWRGSVLSIANGFSWRPGRIGISDEKPLRRGTSTYEIAIEPAEQTFLFVLDGTSDVSIETGRILPLDHGLYRSTRPLQGTTLYKGFWKESNADSNPPTESDLQFVTLPLRTARWISDIHDLKLKDKEKLDKLRELFFKGGFTYTLSPGLYKSDDLDAFLFYRKRGFCEHFAGAYATLARALGIPARVVVGYQGGHYNPLGDFWRISQKDAHAWVEIFTEGHWQRKDPTGWVAPLRLVIGATEFFSLSEEDQLAFARNTDWNSKNQSSVAVWDRISFWVEDLNYRWTFFLIDFDRGFQEGLWARFVLYGVQTGAAILFFVFLSYLVFRNLILRKKKNQIEQKLLVLIEQWGNKKEKPRDLAEPPLSYLRRLQTEFSEFSSLLSQSQEFYDQRSYARKPPTLQGQGLLKKWKDLQ